MYQHVTPFYSIGTILELVRVVAIRLAEQNLRVRICVQGSMGVGAFRCITAAFNVTCKLTCNYWSTHP